MLKPATTLAAALLLLAACNNQTETKAENTTGDTTTVTGDAQEIEPAPVKTELFPELFSYIAKQDSSFTTEKFQEQAKEQDIADQLPLNFSAVAPFKPYLVYNRDSSLAIDAVSSNYVVKEKGGSKQIVQGGLIQKFR